MRVDIIDSVKALAALRANWEAVYEADPEAQVFLSWPWMSRWLGVLKAPWSVLAARPGDGSADYAAFFPLSLQTKERDSGGFTCDLAMGGNYAADYTGFLCRPEFEAEAMPAFAERIKELHWTNLRFEFVRASDRRAELFLQAFPAGAFGRTEIDRINPDKVDNSLCPYAPLPGDWEAYLAGLSANTRQKIRRLLRQLDGSDEFRITHADGGSIARDLDILMRFWTDQWGTRKGKNLSAIQRQCRVMLRHSFEDGRLLLPVLWQGERPVGALAILVDAVKRTYSFYIGGRDATFEGPPAGLMLHAHSIRHAIAAGISSYDFLRGNEPYKYSFAVGERRLMSLMLTRKDGSVLATRLDRRSLPKALKRSLEHDKEGRVEKAERGFRQVLEVEPESADALYALGKILAKRGAHAEAIPLFRTLLSASPQTHRAWFWLGRSLQARGALAEAAAAYCEGIEREPAMPGAYVELAHILLALGQFDQALAAFDAACAVQPGFPGADAGRTKALRVRGRTSAEERARRASLHAAVGDRAAKLGAIAAAAQRSDSGPPRL
jgi:Tfp pilus assembly protein PilF/CelD/BcsL family acetyltransferase involved in cellulose biosynthesis